ncbi:hypothetical protein JCM10213_000928 [Rhodosporidiobolus nylandii]
MSSVASSSRAARTSRGGGGRGASSGGDDGASVASDQHEDEWEGVEDDDDDEPAQPAKKKARKAAPKGKGTGKGKLAKRDEGKLKKLLELPVDILIEMAGHLDPLTLLYLTRVSKSFRRIFASRSATSAWRSARATMDLPDLERNDVSELAYAALLFEKVCQVCGKDRAGIVDCHLFKRLCKLPGSRCYYSCLFFPLIPSFGSFEVEYFFHIRFKDRKFHPWIYECSVPTHNYYFMPALWDVNDELLDIQSRLPASSRFAVPEPENNIGRNGRSVKVPFMKNTISPPPEGWEDGEEELADFVDDKRDLVASAQADAEELKAWIAAGTAGRGKAAEEARKQRLKGIKAKLEELGYDQQDLHTSDTEIKKLVTQPRALSQAIWKRISPTIIKHVEENRDSRLEYELSRRQSAAKFALRPYFEKTKAAYVAENANSEDDFPPFNTFVELATVKPLWETDPAPTLDDASWAAVAPSAVEQATALTRTFKLTLAQQIVKTLEGTQHAVDSSLAVKFVAPEDADEDWTPSLTKDDLDALTKPYMRHLFCGGCTSYYATMPHTFASLSQHATSHWAGHDLAVEEPENWYFPGWAELVASALSQAGAAMDADVQMAEEALRRVGQRWKCEDCQSFRDDLDRDNKWAALYGGAAVGFGWSTMLGHVVRQHLKASSIVPFTLKLAAENEEPVVPPLDDSEDEFRGGLFT